MSRNSFIPFSGIRMVTEPISTKTTLAIHPSVEDFCANLHENTTYHQVTDTRSLMDRWHGLRIRCFFFYFVKNWLQRLNVRQVSNYEKTLSSMMLLRSHIRIWPFMEMMHHIEIHTCSHCSGTTQAMNQTNLQCSIYTTANTNNTLFVVYLDVSSTHPYQVAYQTWQMKTFLSLWLNVPFH